MQECNNLLHAALAHELVCPSHRLVPQQQAELVQLAYLDRLGFLHLAQIAHKVGWALLQFDLG